MECSLAKNWDETSIEFTEATLTCKTSEATDKASRIPSLRNQTNTCRLKRSQQNISKKPVFRIHYRTIGQGEDLLCNTGRPEVDGGTVFYGCFLVSGELHRYFLPIFVPGEFRTTLYEIANSS
jgi:hypothetical protein